MKKQERDPTIGEIFQSIKIILFGEKADKKSKNKRKSKAPRPQAKNVR